MKWPGARWWFSLCVFGSAILIAPFSLAQMATPTGKYAGSAGASCAGLGMEYAWPDANGQILGCVSNVWTVVSPLSMSAGIYLGTSALVTNPARGSGELTTGLFSAGSGLVDVASLGVQIGEFSSAGLNLGTNIANAGALKIGGANGVSYPAAETYARGASIAVGPSALANLPTMTGGSAIYGNIAIGSQVMSGASMTTAAIANTAIGHQAMKSVTGAYNSVAIGYQALMSVTNSIGNTAIGKQTLAAATGQGNTAVGDEVLFQNVSGQQNTAMGYRAMAQNTLSGADYNTAMGASVMFNNTSGNTNTAVGASALLGNRTGSGNVAIGSSALLSVPYSTNYLSGGSNTVVGSNAGTIIQGASANNTLLGAAVGSVTFSTGSYNILIGTDNRVDTPSGTTSNFLNIGNLIYGTSIGSATAPGYVGIGTASPQSTLAVNGGVAIGTTFAGGYAAGSNNLIVQGNVGIGSTATAAVPLSKLYIDFSESSTNMGLTNSLIVENTNSTLNNMSGIMFSQAVAGGTRGAAIYGVHLNRTVGSRLTDLAFYSMSSSNSTEKMRITGAGNIGIGTTVPDAIVSLNGQAAQTIDMVRNTTAATAGQDLTLRAGGAVVGGTDISGGTLNLSSGISTGTGSSGINFKVYTAAGSTASTDNSATTAMTILGSGNVGIGNTSPSSTLAIGSNIGSGGFGLSLKGASFNGGTIGLQNTASSGFSGVNMYDSGGTLAASFQYGNSGSSVPSTFFFGNRGTGPTQIVSGGAATPLMTILNGGNVGIGTSAPANKLDVTGGVTIGTGYAYVAQAAPANGLLVQGNVGIGTTSPTTALTIKSTFNGYGNMSIDENGAGYSWISFMNGSTLRGFVGYNGGYGFQVNGSGVAVTVATNTGGTNPSFKAASNGDVAIGGTIANGNTTLTGATLVAKNGGNVGIGTTNPTSLLHAYTSTAAAVVATFENGSGVCTFAPTAGATNFSCSSDERLKEDIVDAGNALGWIKDFRVRDYTIKADQSRLTGVIAQEVKTTHPEMVHMSGDGLYTVDEPNPWKLVKAIQELKADNDQLRAANDNMRATIAADHRAIEELRKQLNAR